MKPNLLRNRKFSQSATNDETKDWEYWKLDQLLDVTIDVFISPFFLHKNDKLSDFKVI